MGAFKAVIVSLGASLLCALLILGTAYARADEHPAQAFDIPPQELGSALTQFARQSHEEILFSQEVVASKFSPGVRGTMSPRGALEILLKDSGLTVTATPKGVLLVGGPSDATTQSMSTDAGGDSPKEGRKSSSGGLRAAQVDQGSGGQSSPVVSGNTFAPEGSQKVELQEVVVTAQKRVERLQDVPVPVTAIGAQSLVETNQLRLQDYFTKVPGLSVTPDDQFGSPQVTIRGITTGGYTNPTVGIVIDDVPYGSSSNSATGSIAPDIDPFDVERVEVLRGPQGTLYGAASMGGLVKFVTIEPSIDALGGAVQVGTSGVSHGAEMGFSFRGSINLPLNDAMAIRASAFTRQDPGYIDNPLRHIHGINEQHASGGLVSALWKPSDALSVKLSALIQDTNRDGSNDADRQTPGFTLPALGDLEQSDLPSTGKLRKRIQSYSATISAKIGGIDLIAISGYNVSTLKTTLDLTQLLGPFTQAGVPGTGFDGYGTPGTPSFGNIRTSKFTQEVRVSASVGKHLDWLIGAFYTHENSLNRSDTRGADITTGSGVGELYEARSPTTFEEYAIFGNLTLKLTDRFDVQFGARESENRQTFDQKDVGPLVPVFDFGNPSPYVYPRGDSKGNAFTYLITPRLKLSPDLMLYARVASGYRPGGPNPGAVTQGLPSQFAADKTQNYEFGVKGDVLDHKYAFDTSVYYIDWKNIQILELSPLGIGFTENGNRAKSEGVELSARAKPVGGLTIGGWIAWNEAVLTEPFPQQSSAFGQPGDRLPYSSRFSGNISIDQEFVLTGRLRGVVGASASYVGARLGEFPSVFVPPDRQVLPAYTQTDLRAGIIYDESWNIRLFANNIADKRGLLRGGLNTVFPFSFNYIQPRTVGMSLTKSF
jgi:iron complex outermembrane recepter protein